MTPEGGEDDTPGTDDGVPPADASDALLLEQVLLLAGYEVVTAASGEEGLAKVVFARPDLVLGGLANYWGVAIGSIIMWTILEGTRFVDLPISPEREAAVRCLAASNGHDRSSPRIFTRATLPSSSSA